MQKISPEKRERYLQNLRLVNEQAGVEQELVDLIEAFAALELDRGNPVNLHPSAPSRLGKSVRQFLAKNQHLAPTALHFIAAYCQRIHEQGAVFILNPAHLAQRLSLAPEQLFRLATSAEKHYHTSQIPKRNGTLRTLHAPRPLLKRTQRAILDEILAFIPLNPHAEGFRRHHSILTNSQRHVGQKVVVKLDIEDFFPSIGSERIHGLFARLGYPRQVTWLLTRLTTCRGALPTGAPTSPALSNLVCRRLDRRLSAIGERMGFAYSRYADDITLSSQNPRMVQLLPFLREVIGEEGFRPKASKTRILRDGGRQKVTGVVVNTRPNIGRHEIRTLRAILHRCQKGSLHHQARQYAKTRGVDNPQKYSLSSFQASLRGKINHVRAINPEMGDRLLRDFLAINFSG